MVALQFLSLIRETEKLQGSESGEWNEWRCELFGKKLPDEKGSVGWCVFVTEHAVLFVTKVQVLVFAFFTDLL
jgi:hypothetical protein